MSISERHSNRWENWRSPKMHHRTTKGRQCGMRSKKSVSSFSFNVWQIVHYIDIYICTMTQSLPCCCLPCFFLPQLIHRQTQQALSSICLLCLCKTRTVHTVILMSCKVCARDKAYKHSQRALQDKRTLQWCPQNKILQKWRPCTNEEYRDRLGDTLQRKDVHSRQWRFVTHEGIIFSEWKREEDHSTVKQNSEYSDCQWRCGLRHASKGLHQGAWCLSVGTFGGRFIISAIAGKTKQFGYSYS